MTISKQEVLYVADLARLELDDAAVERFAEQIGDILEYVDTLAGVDTTNVKPTSHAISLVNALRSDDVRSHLNTDRALANAPDKEDGTFIVPKVVG